MYVPCMSHVCPMYFRGPRCSWLMLVGHFVPFFFRLGTQAQKADFPISTDSGRPPAAWSFPNQMCPKNSLIQKQAVICHLQLSSTAWDSEILDPASFGLISPCVLRSLSEPKRNYAGCWKPMLFHGLFASEHGPALFETNLVRDIGTYFILFVDHRLAYPLASLTET